jgi:hypothetical protein
MTPEHAKLLLPYEEYRAFWAAYVGRPYPTKSDPGALPIEDPEAG